MPIQSRSSTFPHCNHGAEFDAIPSPTSPPSRSDGAVQDSQPVIDHSVRDNDEVLFLGLEAKTARHEIASLRKRGVQVSALLDKTPGIEAFIDGKRVPLSNEKEIHAFVCALKLSAESSEKLQKLLAKTPPERRDELAQLAQVWAQAEHGKEVPSRVVISGHHVPGDFFSASGESLSEEDFLSLARMFPRAASQVQDIHLSACNTHISFYEMREVFPNLQTFWGYSGSAPGAYSGSTAHLSQWEKATRGDRNDLRTEHARGRKANNVVTWHRGQTELEGLSRSSTEQLVIDAVSFDELVRPYYRGRIDRPPTEVLRHAYETAFALSGRPDITETQKAVALEGAERSLRLLAYDNHIRHAVVHAHGETIKAGYEAAGLSVPNFSELSRKEALEAIDALLERERSMAPSPKIREAAQVLKDTLVLLKPEHVPTLWLTFEEDG